MAKTAPRSPGRRYGALKKLDCSQCLEFQRRRVVEAIPREDEHVRFIQVEYKNPTEDVFRHTLCPVQKVLLLVKLFINFRYRYIIFMVSEYCGYFEHSRFYLLGPPLPLPNFPYFLQKVVVIEPADYQFEDDKLEAGLDQEVETAVSELAVVRQETA